MTTDQPKILAAALLLALLCSITIIVYLPGLSGDYMFDDMSNVLNNEWLQLDSLDTESLQSAAYSSGAGLFRRPVSMVTFALNRYFFGIDPWSYKATNLVIHILTGIGILLLTRLIMQSYRSLHRPALSDRTMFWLPLVVTGFWLLHPLNLTPVLYIVQRMTSLAALFTVFGACLYTLGRQQMLAGGRGIVLILTGLLLFGGLASLSKETGVLLPLYLLVIELGLFRFRARDGSTSRFISGFFAVVILVPLCLALLVLLVNPDSILNYHSRSYTMLERVLTEARVLVFYLKLIIMPSISELGLYHDDIALSHGLLDPPTTLYSIMALAGLLTTGLALLGRRPLVAMGILWFFAGHALESTIFQLDIAYEHRNYLADLGIILALTSLVAEQPVSRAAVLAKSVIPAVFMLLFAYTTWLRASQWQDNVDHAIYEARHHPESAQAVYSAARIFARLSVHGTPGAADKSFSYLEQAAALDTADIMPDVVRVKLSFLHDRPVDPQWYENILSKLANHPMRASAIDSLHELIECIGVRCDIPLDTMDRIMNTALENKSLEHLPGMYAELLNIYGQFVINKMSNFDKGYQLFSRVVEIQPGEPQRWINLIKLQLAMGRLEEASTTLERFRSSNIRGSASGETLELQSRIDALRAESGNPSEPTATETLQP